MDFPLAEHDALEMCMRLPLEAEPEDVTYTYTSIPLDVGLELIKMGLIPLPPE